MSEGGTILFLLYGAAGYWACGKTIYANSVRVGEWGALFARRFLVGVLLGWLLIPIAIIRCVTGK